MLKFPYGICDFDRIQTNDYFYVDRTSHIRLIEEFGDHLLFLRPRRFGKSLLLSMLENYYDVAKAEEFEKLFGHLAIGKNPTPKHNQYFVMKWDFSMVSPEGDIKEIRQALHDHVNGCIEQFIARYQPLLEYELTLNPNNAVRSFQSVLAAISQTPYRLYLLIDEYDNFANEVMMARGEITPNRYKALLSGEGSLKALFKAVKSASSGQGLERAFITGVSPVVMTDITSAYNIAENIYLEPEFNDLCGFQKTEIRLALETVVTQCHWPINNVQEALTMMQTFYNGYCFSLLSTQFIYNPTLALYFLKAFQRHCQFPSQMLDDNLAMDRGKLTYIAGLPNGEQVIVQAVNSKPPLTLKQLSNRFGVEDVLYSSKDTRFIISLLYYFGILTLAGETVLLKPCFKIPNLVMHKLYVERLFEKFLPQEQEREQTSLLAEQFYQTGDLQPLCDFMEQRYFKVFDNRDYKIANELTIKTAFLTLLFDDFYYIMDFETEIERRYADLTMILRPERRQLPLLNLLLEFKYVSLKEVGIKGTKARELSIDEIKALTAVQQKLTESKQQLMDYHHRLSKKYDDSIKLHLISVVALGFERVVWKNFSAQS